MRARLNEVAKTDPARVSSSQAGRGRIYLYLKLYSFQMLGN